MDRERILYEGILVGLAGAVAVAVWFFLYDLAAGMPFRTPALLGAALFEGLRDTAMLTITPGIVLKYTAVHGLVFLVFGMAAAGLFALAERDRHVLLGVFMLFCCFEVAVLPRHDGPEFLALQHTPPMGDPRWEPRGGADHAGNSLPRSSFLAS